MFVHIFWSRFNMLVISFISTNKPICWSNILQVSSKLNSVQIFFMSFMYNLCISIITIKVKTKKKLWVFNTLFFLISISKDYPAFEFIFSDSFRWTEANTKAVITDFKEWVNTEKGNSLPSSYFFSFHASVKKFFDKSNFSVSLCYLQRSVETFIWACNMHTVMQTGNFA